jgi:RNA-directed DNA polymerase
MGSRGEAQRLPDGSGRGGARVLVGAWESHVQGEGGQQVQQYGECNVRRSLVNTDVPWPDRDTAWWRVLRMQTKLHQWAGENPERRFDDLFNLVADPAFLMAAWDRVRTNTGARSAGVDGWSAYRIEAERGVDAFLTDVREKLKTGTFRPEPVRERMVPKTGGKLRRLGIPTITDRVVQAALKQVLEPIFEADFRPCSYGFRPRRRAQDAIAEIHLYGSHKYEWVLEADIEACLDAWSHCSFR